MEGASRRSAIFGGKVTPVGAKFVHESRGNAYTAVELAGGILVDQVDLNVFIAAHLAAGGIGLAKQINTGGSRLRAPRALPARLRLIGPH